MDLFTHVLLGYLLSFAIWGPSNTGYIAAGAMAAGLPDADILLFPLARRYPLLRHRGITHTFLGITVMAGVGAFVVPRLFAVVEPGVFPPGSPVLYFLALEFGALTHIAFDGFTNFAVQPLMPFSPYQLHLDAERAVNFGMTAVTLVSLWYLGSERGAVPLARWEETAWLVLAGYAIYLGVRGVLRVRMELLKRRDGYTGVIPSGWPHVWYLVDESLAQGGLKVRWRKYVLGRGFTTPDHRVEVSGRAPSAGPVADPQAALERSFAPSMARSRFLADSYRYAEVERHEGSWWVFWYSLEFSLLQRCGGVMARVDADSGEVTVKSAWRVPPAFGGPALGPAPHQT